MFKDLIELGLVVVASLFIYDKFVKPISFVDTAVAFIYALPGQAWAKVKSLL